MGLLEKGGGDSNKAYGEYLDSLYFGLSTTIYFMFKPQKNAPNDVWCNLAQLGERLLFTLA